MSTHTLHSQHDRWKKKKKKHVIIFIFNSVVTTYKQQQGFWSLPLPSSALTLPLPYKSISAWDPLQSCSPNVHHTFSTHPASKAPAKNTWASYVQATKGSLNYKAEKRV